MRVVAAPYVLLGAPPAGGGRAPALRDGRGEALPTGDSQGQGAPQSVGRGLVPRRNAPGVIRDGALALDGDQIVAVGPRGEIEARYGTGEWLDAALLPALVNAHLHLELSHLAGRIPGGEGLVPWIEKLVAARQRAGGVEEAMAPAAASLARAGVAAAGDVGNTLDSLRHLAREGIGGTLFHEVFGFSAERALAAAAAATEMRERAGPPPPGLRVVPSPHAVYSTNPRILGELLSSGPASIHLAEDSAERAFCSRMEGPLADLSRRLGAIDLSPLGRSAVACAAPHLHARALAVHVVDLDTQDLADLSGCGAAAVLCPRSNLFIGRRLPDLPRLLDAGVPLAVGTDSLASSPSLSPLAELAELHRAFPQVQPQRLLPLAWNGSCVGAPAVGRLAPGTAPGIIAAPLGAERPQDPFAWLLGYGAEERAFAWIARYRPEVAAA